MKFKYFVALCFILSISANATAERVSLHKELQPEIEMKHPEVRVYKHHDGATITEYKSSGNVWMIKVKPAGNFPAYYLYDDTGDGSFERRIMGNQLPSAPMWVIKRF